MHFPDNILNVLQDAIINVFWRKNDMQALFKRSSAPQHMFSMQDWSQSKYHILHPVLEKLNSNPEGLGPLRFCVLL